MKHLVKTLIGASTMVLVFGSCSNIPGTQKWKIKKAATAYIELGLKDGESIRWGSIRRKLHREVKGNTYTYAEVIQNRYYTLWEKVSLQSQQPASSL